MLGGRVRLIPCGAAPFKYEILQFFRAALGAVVLEGYGQTECCGCCIVSVPGDYSGGRVGGLIPNCVLKLESVPEMGYQTENNQGIAFINHNSLSSPHFTYYVNYISAQTGFIPLQNHNEVILLTSCLHASYHCLQFSLGNITLLVFTLN